MRIIPRPTSPRLGGIAAIVTALGLLGAPSAFATPIGVAPGTGTLREVTISRAAVAARFFALRQHPCGTAAVSPAVAEGVRATLDRWAEENAAGAPGGTIRVAFHVITSRGEGEVSDARLTDQVRELNRAYEGSGYRFELDRVDRTDEPEWFRMTPGSALERKAKETLAIEPARHLNIYVCAPAQGWATYPWDAPESHFDHGVVVDHATLPGGPAAQDVRAGAIHLVGHYLGLLEADGAGDAAAGFGGAQVERMRGVVPIYRPSLFTIPPPRGVAKPEIVPTAGSEPEDGRVLSFRGAYPNPFRAETAFRFTLPSSQPVTLKVYSVTGQHVRTLLDATLPPGDHSAMFRADDLPSGAYFAVLRAGQVQMSRTIMLVR